jgi:hypothetical protein
VSLVDENRGCERSLLYFLILKIIVKGRIQIHYVKDYYYCVKNNYISDLYKSAILC